MRTLAKGLGTVAVVFLSLTGLATLVEMAAHHGDMDEPDHTPEYIAKDAAFNITSNAVKNSALTFHKLGYDKGVYEALSAFMLLDLEQRLEGTNRTWGAMSAIVCQRLKVETPKEWDGSK
jgi:hypothetical protein